jgi:hypothetical protein
MPKKEHQPGFLYMQSKELNQEIALSEKSGWVFCEDGVKYSPQEVQIIKAGGNGKIDLGVHNAKKVFGGEVVKYEFQSGTDNSGKSDAGKEFDSTDNNTDSGRKIPETTGNIPAVRPGELEIY